MIAAICRLASALLFASVLFAAAPTRADSISSPITVQQHYDIPIVHSLEMLLDAADTQELTMRGFAHVRHNIDIASIRIWPSPQLGFKVGVGTANLVDSPVACAARTRGTAMAGSIYYAILQPRGLSLGVELSTLNVMYGSGEGLHHGTVMLALSTR